MSSVPVSWGFFYGRKDGLDMEKLTTIREEALNKIASCKDMNELQSLRVLYLGKKGPIQEVMKSMKDLPKEERPAFGQQVN